MKIFRIAQFVCALILFLCTIFITAINARMIASLPDAPVLFGFFGLTIILSASLVRLAGKELK